MGRCVQVAHFACLEDVIDFAKMSRDAEEIFHRFDADGNRLLEVRASLAATRTRTLASHSHL